VLIEAAVTIGLLGVVGMLLLRGSLNALAGRTWTIAQNLTDAHLTFETALAQRVPFDRITALDSPWPVAPATAATTVEIGRMPGGNPVTATVHRSRIPDPANLPAAGGTGSTETNPAGMEAWKLQSHLLYTVGGKPYRKSRTIVRAR
jgi:hypothetical protein